MKYLFVWEDVLTDYSSGIAFAFARNEAGAWRQLKKADSTAWWVLRDKPQNQDDKRKPEELPVHCRPKKIKSSIAYTCWGGG